MWLNDIIPISNGFSLQDVERVLQGEVWRLATSQIIFRNKAQAIVGLILLYTCRQFERQMGSRKFGAFLLFSLTTSILSLLGLIVIFASVGYNLVPSSGPYFLIFSLVAFYYCKCLFITQDYQCVKHLLCSSHTETALVTILALWC